MPFFALVTFLLLLDRSGTAICGFCAALLHEGGHLVAMRCCGRTPHSVRLTIFGAEIVAAGNASATSFWADAWVAVGGPAANLLMWGFSELYLHDVSKPYWLYVFALANLLLAVFNLLPVEPLDGGQALLSVLSLHMERTQARRVVRVCSFAILLPLAAAGFLLLFRSRWNLTLLAAAVYLLFLLVMKPERYE